MKLVNRIKRNMTSDNVGVRIITTYICLLIIFISVTIVSYYLLPQSLLRNKHPLQNWDTSPDLAISTIQILSYNLISVVVILFANLFSNRKNKTHYFMPLGYTTFFVLILINAVTLGTWSFSFGTGGIPLADRIIRIFDIFHSAGLWEMSGQLFILCATAKISLVMIDGKETIIRNWKTIKLSKLEIIVFVMGLILMIIGAFVESYAIINLK
ncbi:MAG: hypothetical protein GXY89_05355 [Tissierellia bacterium]|nr:hypothetical protein [Tissierellia bacterium]